MFWRRLESILMVILVLIFMTGLIAQAGTEYPTRTIEIVVPSGTGGGQDTLVRVLEPLLEKILGVGIKVTNVPGGSHTKGILYSYEAPADGYTIHCLSPSDLASDIFKKLNITFTEEFVPLCRFQHDTSIFWGGANGKFKDIYEVIEYAKKYPGAVTIAAASPGGIDDAVIGLFSNQTGAKLTLIPTKGGERLSMTIGGHYHMVCEEAGSVGDLMKTGDLIPFFVARATRIDNKWLKDAVCSEDLGIDVSIGTWRGFALKKGTPQEIVDILAKAFEDAYNLEEYKKYEKENLLNLRPGWLGPEEFGKSWQEEIEAFTDVFKSLGRL